MPVIEEFKKVVIDAEISFKEKGNILQALDDEKNCPTFQRALTYYYKERKSNLSLINIVQASITLRHITWKRSADIEDLIFCHKNNGTFY